MHVESKGCRRCSCSKALRKSSSENPPRISATMTKCTVEWRSKSHIISSKAPSGRRNELCAGAGSSWVSRGEFIGNRDFKRAFSSRGSEAPGRVPAQGQHPSTSRSLTDVGGPLYTPARPQTAETSRPTVFCRDEDWRCEPSLARPKLKPAHTRPHYPFVKIDVNVAFS